MNMRTIRNDQSGATIVEFAMVAPILFVLVMGTLDLGHALYIRSVLEGETQAAARASSLQSASDTTARTALDDQIELVVKKIAGNDAVLAFSRKAYGTYKATERRAEEYVDANDNGECDDGENFADSNGDGEWSADGGVIGQGSAKDVQEYTVTIRYDRKFPTTSLFGWDNEETLVVKTLLRNQPFGTQATPSVLTCD